MKFLQLTFHDDEGRTGDVLINADQVVGLFPVEGGTELIFPGGLHQLQVAEDYYEIRTVLDWETP